MKRACFVIFALSVAAASGAKLHCNYQPIYLDVMKYMCNGQMTTTKADYLVDEVSGAKTYGANNDEVYTVNFDGASMEVLPKNLASFFKNYEALVLSNIKNLENFKRSDFYDFTQLTFFAAYKIPSITTLPRDTFFDMTRLKSLQLASLVNMENLHEDLLLNLRELVTFSARGPNKINQISPGFFRSQTNTLVTVDFSGSNLVRIGHSIFPNLPALKIGNFENAGCLTHNYYMLYPDFGNLVDDVRTQCQDITMKANEIAGMKVWSSESSE